MRRNCQLSAYYDAQSRRSGGGELWGCNIVVFALDEGKVDVSQIKLPARSHSLSRLLSGPRSRRRTTSARC